MVNAKPGEGPCSLGFQLGGCYQLSDIKISVLLSLFRNHHFQREAGRGRVSNPCCFHFFSLLVCLSIPFYHFTCGYLIPAAVLGHLYLSHPSFYFSVQKFECTTKKTKQNKTKPPPTLTKCGFPPRFSSKHVTLMLSKLHST